MLGNAKNIYIYSAKGILILINEGPRNVTRVPSCAYNRVMSKVKFKVQSNYAYIHSRKVVCGALNRKFQNVLLWMKFNQMPSAVNFVQNQLCRYYYFNNKELGTFG